MTPYLERRSQPGNRRWLVVLCAALLVMPVGVLLPGNGYSTGTHVLAILAIVIVAPLLGMGVARPRRTVIVDADTVTVRTSGELPDPRAQERRWPTSQVTLVELVDLGTPVHPSYGVRIDLDGEEPLHLNAYTDRDLAQDTVDHLVLLGLPGHSRHADREQSLTAAPPETWL